MAPSEDHSSNAGEAEPPTLQELGRDDNIDMAAFDQVIDMDEDDDEREFSRSIVFDFFDQARSTFEKMDSAIAEKDLATLSSLGHFLKGSSATLGLPKVRDSCEQIQHLGAGMDETGNTELDDDACLLRIRTTLKVVRRDFVNAEKILRRFYGEAE